MDGKVYFKGLPTEMDVKVLRDTFPQASLTVGLVIPYERVEKLIKERKGSFRFNTVTNRWRKEVERNFGVILGVQAGVGFEVKSDSQKVGLASQKNRSATRCARRALKVSALVAVAKLNDDEKNTHLFNVQRAGAFMATAQLRGGNNLPSLTQGE